MTQPALIPCPRNEYPALELASGFGYTFNWRLNPACNRGIVGPPCPDVPPFLFGKVKSARCKMKHISKIIEQTRPGFSAVVESSISSSHDIEITEHGLGLDIAQNGLVVHVDHSQFDDLIDLLKGAG